MKLTSSKQLLSRSMLIIVSLAFSLLLLGCPSTPNRPTEVNSTPPPPAKSDFDGDRALDHVRKQVEFGPRPPASPELEKTRAYLVDQLRSFGLTVTTDEFQATTPVGPRKMANIVAELPGSSSDIVIISSHYDTKLMKEFKFVGANDGGSSTGAVIEIARVLGMKKQSLKLTYRFVFFDGEEAFCANWDDCNNPNPADPSKPLPDNTYGSRHYVSQLVEKNELNRVKAMILLDMIGYKNLALGRNETLSTRWLIDAVWDTASELGYGEYFTDDIEHCDGDDHVPFLQEGIESLDIIQLDSYDYWHRAEDTLDKISPQSLKIVSDVVLASLPRIEQRLLSARPPA